MRGIERRSVAVPTPAETTTLVESPKCAKRMLAGALDIHAHETHSGTIVEEADGAHDETKILAAHGKR